MREFDQEDRSCGRRRARNGDGGRDSVDAGRGSVPWRRRRLSWRRLPWRRLWRRRLSRRRLGRRRLAWRRLGRRLAWRLGPARMGRRRLGLAARGLGWLGWWLGRRLLELRLGRRLGLGLGSGLGDRGGDRAHRGRDRIAAGLWRRTGLLGQAARLDGERPLSGPAAREHLLLSILLCRARQPRLQVKKIENRKLKPRF